MLMLIIITTISTPSYSFTSTDMNIIYAEEDSEKTAPSDEEPDCE